MAKAWTDERYTLNWTGQSTGYKYKLVITPSDTTAITATDIELPEDCILDYLYSWEYDTYPIGMNNPTFEITFNLDLCLPNFAKMLYDPFADGIITLSIAQPNYNIILGNVYELYIAYDGINYIPEFVGVQQSGKDFEFTENDRNCKVEVVDISYYILNNIPTNYLWSCLQNEYDHVQMATGYYDWNYYWSSIDTYFSSLTRNDTPNFKYWFIPVKSIFEWINSISDEIAKLLYRVPGGGVFGYDVSNIKNIMTNYYMQQYTGSGGISTGIAVDDLLCLMFGSTENNEAYWWTALADQSEFGKLGMIYVIAKEYESCWDFIKDFTNEHLRRAWSKTDKSLSTASALYKAQTIFINNYIDLSSAELTNISLSRYEVLQKASAVSIDKIEETLDKLESTKDKAKNDNDFSVNFIMQNTPFAGEILRTFGGWVVGNTYTAFTNKVNNSEIFYQEPNYTGVNEFDIVRVCEKCIFPISDTLYTSDVITIPNFDLTDAGLYPNGTITAPDYYPIKDDGTGTGNIFRQSVAETTGKGKILAESLLYLFGDENQCKLAATCNLSDLAKMDRIQTVPAIIDKPTNNVFDPSHELYFNLALIESHSGMFSQLSNRFIMLNAKLNKDETVEFEAISRRADTL